MIDAATTLHLLRAAAPGTVLLDAARPDRGAGRSLLFVDPVRVVRADTAGEVERVLEALDGAVRDGCYAAGYLSYEAGLGFEEVEGGTEGESPLAWFGIYEAPYELTAEVVSAALEKVTAGRTANVEEVRFNIDRATYRARVAAVKEAIREGEVYQINFTDAVTFRLEGTPAALYRDLRQSQRVAYGALIDDGQRHILSLSPELFFRRDGDRIRARPMKGTVRRGRTQAEDEVLQQWLVHDEKSRAENLMIVDLLRNDLSVCCRPGTVQVPALFEATRYETVIQMTSDVVGELRSGVGYRDLFHALFPCGSVTGAPKIRAMKYIRELERGPRGVYCGAIGFVAPDEHAVFNVAIRTIVLEQGQGRMGTGSGLVWGSNPDVEYDECLLKARFLTEPEDGNFELIETMRCEDGCISLLDHHLDRLRSSAGYFGFTMNEGRVRQRITVVVGALDEATYKVRLTLGRDGTVDVTSTPVEPWVSEPVRLVLAAHRVRSSDTALFHKTSRRQHYETAFRQAQQQGYDEALFINERGELTEGTRTNLFVRMGRIYVTPPLDAGVLPGVFRRHLLETLPEVEERALTPGDLSSADAVYVCNAVYGLQRAELHPRHAHEKSQRPD